MTTELPSLASPYALTVEQVTSYQRDGQVLLRGVCTAAEMRVWSPVIAEAAARFQCKLRPLEERDTAGKAFSLVCGIWNREERMAQFTLARRFARIAAELMGVPAVRLYHDVAINKEPGGGYTPWHQDSLYWPMDTHQTVTMWMPLVDLTGEMGTLNFADGSYHAGDLGNEAISDYSQEYFERVIQARGFSVVNPGAERGMAAGDATFHAGWTLHSAPGNPTTQARQVITVVYFAEGTRTFADMGNPHREADFCAYMPGVTPGELAVSPLNPLVYTKEILS